jgi:hypothetical protein
MAINTPALPRRARELISYGMGLGMSAPRTLAFAAERLLGVQDPHLPSSNLSAGLIAQVALDELILAAMKTPGRIPTEQDYEAAQRDVLRAHELHLTRGWDSRPHDYHPTPAAPDVADVSRAWWMGGGWEQVRFHSDFSPQPGTPSLERWMSLEPNRTMHAWVLRRPGPRPWLVCVHPFGTGNGIIDAHIFRARALHHELGVNIAMPVLPAHGPRRIGRPNGTAFMNHNPVDVQLGLAQSLWDVRRLIGWLREEQATAISVYGVSLGAHVSGLLAAFEPDLHAVVAGVPTCDMLELYNKHIPSHASRNAIRYGLIGPEARDVLSVVAPCTFEPVVSPERLFIYAATGDRMAPPEQAQQLWRHWDEPTIRWFDTNHIAFLWSGEITGFVRDALRSSLDEAA